jgi:small subunit ribosomal protein S18
MSEPNDQAEQETPATAESNPATDAAVTTTADAPTPAAPSAPSAPAPYVRPSTPYEGQSRRPPGGAGGRRFTRRKVCQFCADKMDFIDYKDTKRIRKFMTDRGKILPRRITGNCATHQRMLTNAIKRARVVALVPFKVD